MSDILIFILGFAVGGGLTGSGALWLWDNSSKEDER